MFPAVALFSFSLLAVVYGQQVGTAQPEVHPPLSVQVCTAPGRCTTQQKSITLDSNWRWVHNKDGYNNCYTGNSWDSSLCPNPTTCVQNCALDGANYASTYGITTSGNSLNLKFVTGANVGSRVYLMQDDNNYEMLKLKNKEFTFDVDMSTLPCGLNGALYFVSMDQDGGKSRFPSNKAGAKYGTGYCDAQCPHDIKFINGEANVLDWSGSPTDGNAGAGRYGTCCHEMDVWEANSVSTAYTPHVCSVDGQYRCEGIQCGSNTDRYRGVCDKDGCDFNSFRLGDKNFLGPGKTVDTTKKVTVVTQFITADNTTTGALSEIRRVYVQNGRVIQNSNVKVPGVREYDSVTEQFCKDQKSTFGDLNDYSNKGGMAKMGAALEKGMVLVMSIWGDHFAHMLWLDSNYPIDADPTKPGVARGTCPTDSGKPSDLVSKHPNAAVTFSNIKWGPIGSTFSGN